MQVVFDAHPDDVFTVEAVRAAGDRPTTVDPVLPAPASS